ncbi:hypothetical protein CS022_23325 [Veronia nyctiphanis]|uniref:Cytochrome c domain-containing protein n=1 Tax=Veronia nyctiphanis TaxID=1278244 RepID=A0A4Q0YI83_9GAMM|nr:hypothetical protein [Veronia nyctiphanis]RXJ70410.1 hypothetical protein CS022_23325 [Veronia nyctiphanis]
MHISIKIVSKFSLTFLIIFSSSAFSNNAPQTFPPEYNAFDYPVKSESVAVSFGCLFFGIFSPCERNEETELAFEREFFSHVQNIDYSRMAWLLFKMKGYAYSSDSPYTARILRLIAFGNIMLSQKDPNFSIDNIPFILAARTHAGASEVFQPSNLNTLSLTSFTDSLLTYALGQKELGNQINEGLIEIGKQHGEPGLEAIVVAAFSYIYSTDKTLIQKGLDILEDCTTYLCERTTSLGPFRQVGVMMTIAEGYVALSQKAKATEILQKAKTFAEDNFMPTPLLERLEVLSDEILEGEYSREAPKLQGMGFYRLPAGPSQWADACALCHAGAIIPAHYYSWK